MISFMGGSHFSSSASPACLMASDTGPVLGGADMPTDQHSSYSLRHIFQDRILSVNCPDRIQADLMGHKFNRPVYGAGATLAHKLEWMEKVKLK